jgi:hypothetical protein
VGKGAIKNTPYTHFGYKRRLLAVPLSFLTCPAAIGAEPEAITPHAPGCTSHPDAADPLSAGEGSSLFFVVDATLSVLHAFRPLYYHSTADVSSLRQLFCPFLKGNLRLTVFQLLFLVIFLCFWYPVYRNEPDWTEKGKQIWN